MRVASKVSITSIFVIAVGLVAMSYFGVINDSFVTIVTVLTAIVGAFGIWLELNKEQEINQASFILEIHSNFYALGGKGSMLTADFEKRLDDDFAGKEKLQLTEKDSEMVVQYLVWVKTLASLINRKTIKISAIDDLFAYKFFIAVNNPQVQAMELVPYASAYKGIYKAHKDWKKYRLRQGQEIYNEETDLSKAENYKALSK